MNNKPVLYWWTRFAASFVRGAATVVLVWSTIGLAVAFADPSITLPVCSNQTCNRGCTLVGLTCSGSCAGDPGSNCIAACTKGCAKTGLGNCECQ